MGKSQREKGNRAEYAIRNQLRNNQFEADRVPCSGAAQGFKGDVRAKRGGHEYFFEVKARAKGFTTVYTLFNTYAADGVLTLALGTQQDYTLLRICEGPDKALQGAGLYAHAEEYHVGKRLSGKLLNMRKWVKDCDVLVIKDDRQPPLYLRYL